MSADPKKEEGIRQWGIMTFDLAIAQRNIGQEAEIIPLLKGVWNQAIESADEMIAYRDGGLVHMEIAGTLDILKTM